MTTRPPDALASGLATSIGSLPHTDAAAAVALALHVHPDLPAAPQLPARDPREGMLAQAARALPEIEVGTHGELGLQPERAGDEVHAEPDESSHGGLLAFLDACDACGAPPPRVKVQVAGPLTLGVALVRAGIDPSRAFTRAAAAVVGWVRVLHELLGARLPGAAHHLWLDEPALVLWRRGAPPLEREAAVDLLSSALAASRSVSGIHVCGAGDVRLAFEAGPTVLGVAVSSGLADDAAVIGRHLDAGGWVAWGAVPTDGPVGESAEPYRRRLGALWGRLADRGADPDRLRAQALVTPACGLAGHRVSQAERVLRLAAAVGAGVAEEGSSGRGAQARLP